MNDANKVPVPCTRCQKRVFVHPDEAKIPQFCDECKVLDFDFKLARLVAQIADLEINARLDRDRISQLEDDLWKLRGGF